MLKPPPQIVRRIDLGTPLPGEPRLWMTVEVNAPGPDRAPSAALFCTPGGGMNRRYFDLTVEGCSLTQAMTARGMFVIALDCLGVGESSQPENGFAITADLLAKCNQIAVTQIVQALRNGLLDPALPPYPSLVSIGLGHSMGAMLTILQQVAYAPHTALVLLGFATRGLPEYLNDAERQAAEQPDWSGQIECLARDRFGGRGYFPAAIASRKGSAAAAALLRAQDHVLATPAMQSMMPGNVSEDAARIDVPIFLALGERDMTGPVDLAVQCYPSCRDLTLHIVRDAGHHPFIAPGTADLFDRLGVWMADHASAVVCA
jgi:pimeloyl-ACP methyl ester carboxylesterase